MFGRKATDDRQAADEASAHQKAASSSEGLDTEHRDEEVDTEHRGETEGGDEDSKTEKPQQSSWWRSALGSLDYASLLNTAQTAMADPAVKDAVAKAGGKDQPDTDQLLKALAAQQNATGLLQKAQNLKEKAMKCLNPEERQKMMQEAYDKEVQANGQSKMARRMQSGAWQGGAGGAGIGGGVGMGLGTVVGALVGGVVSLPTTALGGLVGAGVGGIHGPFVKLNQKKAKEVEAREKAKGKSKEEIEEAVKAEALEETSGEGAEGAEDVTEAEGTEITPQTSAETGTAAQGVSFSQPEQDSAKRNLQRQQSTGTTTAPTAGPGITRDPNKPRKKPRKLEVRSANKPSSTTKSGKENKPAQKG